MEQSLTLIAGISSLAGTVIECVQRGGTIFLAGNGGFGSIAQHFASELTGKFSIKRQPVAAIALNADSTAITCIANDYGFERVFARQLVAAREGDLFIGMSSSGRSKNILEAIYAARDRKVKTVALTGDSPVEAADISLSLPGGNTAINQEIGLLVCHALCRCIDETLSQTSDRNVWQQALGLAAANRADTLLLDRDGVINRLIPNGYVLTPDQLHINADLLSMCGPLAAAFKHIFVVTNQKCVGKGLLSPEGLEKIHQAMTERIEQAGGRIDAIYCSTDADPGSTMSKPATGLADCIAIDYPEIDFARAVMVGDSAGDRLFAERIGAKYLNHNAL